MICKSLWDELCLSGVHVIERYVGEATEWTYGDRGGFTVGTQWTIVTWAVAGSCPSKANPLEALTHLDLHRHNRF